MNRAEIRKLAESGDRSKIEQYIRANKSKANKRIANLEKTFGRGTMRSRALNVSRETLSNIGLSKFGGRLGMMDIGDLETQALELQRFLSRASSTTRGVHKREKATLKYFEETGRAVEVEDRDKFFEILSSELAQEYYKLASGEVIQSASQWANSPDFDISLLDKIWKEYEQGKIKYINEAWEQIE